jgi:raffinose/stachyose/melibiose transport system substrate-binding protein
VFGRGTWADPAIVRAAQQLANWAKAGYFEKGFDSEKYNDSPTPFAKGEGVFMIGGPWFASDLRKKMGDKVRYMLPPPARVGGPSATLGGPGLPLAITAKSKHPDVAAAYLDFMTSPQAMDVVLNTGGLPAIPPATAKPATPIAQDLATAWKNASAHDSLIPYLDYSTPTFLDTLGGILQEILAGKKTAKQGMQDAQKDYGDFLDHR